MTRAVQRFTFVKPAMNTFQIVQLSTILIGALLSPTAARAGELAKKPGNEVFGRDIILSDSTLLGRYVNDAGAGINDVRASIRQAGKEVASGVTDAQGNFRISGLQTGVYEVIVGCRSEFIRVWETDAAPPKAHPTARIVRDDHTAAHSGTGTGGALRLMGAGGNVLDLFGSLFGTSAAPKDSPTFVPSVP